MIQIVHENIESILCIEYTHVNTLVIEEPPFYREIIEQFYRLFNGEDSKLVVTKKNDEIKVKDDMVFCKDYFQIDISKKIQTILSKQLIAKMQSNCYVYNEFYYNGYKLLNDIIHNYDSKITLADEIDLSTMLKLYNPTIDLSYCQGKVETIIEYINILIEFVNLRFIVFLGLEIYFSQNEVEQILQHCKYKEVAVLLLEASRRYVLPNEKCVIIDKDLCEICSGY